MTDEARKHSSEEVKLLVAIAEMKTAYKLLNDNFNEHRKEDEAHFERLYDTLRDTRNDIGSIPQKIIERSETLKTEVLTISRNEFTSKIDFRVFKTWIVTGIIAGTSAGTLVASVINYFWSTMGV